MSRRRTRPYAYRLRRLKRQRGRHYWIDEPMPDGGRRVTEYRRGVPVMVDICPAGCE